MSRLPDADEASPDAPTPEAREGHIRELRARRRARRRKLAIRSGIGTGVALLLVAAFAYWLLTTLAGATCCSRRSRRACRRTPP